MLRQRAHTILLVVVLALSAGAVVGMALMWPERAPVIAEDVPGVAFVDARLDAVEYLREDEVGLYPGAVVVEVTATIDDTGEQVVFEMVDDTGETFSAGQAVSLQSMDAPDGGGVDYQIADIGRGGPLAVLAGLFVVAVIGFARLQGVRALLGLALTFGIIVAFIIPAVVTGSDPLTVTLLGAVAIMIITLYLAHGFSPKTTAAVVGTALALAFTGVLAGLFTELTALSGLVTEEARLVGLEVGGLSLRGLLLAGMILGGLGVLDDVTISQSSTVLALHRADPAAPARRLFTRALEVGRDHIAATVNTLFLAYAGVSLPALILFAGGERSLVDVLTFELIAVEIVRTLVGSIGLIAAVPLTTGLATWLVRDDTPPDAGPRGRRTSDGHGG